MADLLSIESIESIESINFALQSLRNQINNKSGHNFPINGRFELINRRFVANSID